MRFLERLRRQQADEIDPKVDSPDQGQVVLPHPDLIDLESHQLRHYPGAKEFINDWNEHVLSPSRMYRYQRVQDAISMKQGVATRYEQMLTEAEEDLKRREARLEEETVAYEISKDLGSQKQQGRRPVRKAKTLLENSQSRYKSIEITRDADMCSAERTHGQMEERLGVWDLNFALEEVEAKDDRKPEDRVVFFAILILGNDKESVDRLFGEYSDSRNITTHFDLRSLNFGYEAIKAQMEGIEVDYDAIWEKATENALRQRPELKSY